MLLQAAIFHDLRQIVTTNYNTPLQYNNFVLPMTAPKISISKHAKVTSFLQGVA